MSGSSQEFNNCLKQFRLHNRMNLFMTLVVQVIVVITNVSLAFFIMMIVNSMEQKNQSLFFCSMLFMLLVVVIYFLFSTLLKYFKNLYMKRALSQFKKYVFEKILKKSISEFNNEFSGKFISAFTNDLNSIEMNYLNGNIAIFNYAVMFFIAILAMAYVNLVITLCVLFGCLIPVAVSLILGKKLVAKERKTSDENATFVDQIKDLLNGFLEIKSFKAENEVLALFGEQNFTLEETKRERRDTNDTMLIAGQISSLVVIIIIFILGIIFIFKGTMTIASVLGCVQLSNYITDPIKQLVSLISNKKASIGLISKLADIIKERVNQAVKEIHINEIKRGITLKDVTLKYEEGPYILNHINMVFSKGKSYAIVGGSGSGKSTLIKLMLGYFENYGGKVEYDDKELSTINLDSLYDVVSVIQQNVFLFDKSIKNNITMFKEFDEEKMEHAISLAGLKNLIAKKGEDYNCGESGSNLSGGEKQRISIARCLLRETPVLLMDEATASLDNATAYLVENQILQIEGITRIIVTHRLEESLLRKYDEILVMRDGRIEEAGNFEKLMKAGGYFSALFLVAKEGCCES
ncbi:ABC transporter ATP-binding protein [Lachnotalea glycerini]|uniref:ABC transporter ATP-binding protein n=1 Tax=Lachnotalea glycerini TaxID=1763509 RepID=A0A371JJL2_9FIRM|nr:ABC transporter ATP-binding protein [Lachnotalea glycerini]RDY32919.1 ABC transporter ATP-binding protein [Lachnotalea glycerini]